MFVDMLTMKKNMGIDRGTSNVLTMKSLQSTFF